MSPTRPSRSFASAKTIPLTLATRIEKNQDPPFLRCCRAELPPANTQGPHTTTMRISSAGRSLQQSRHFNKAVGDVCDISWAEKAGLNRSQIDKNAIERIPKISQPQTFHVCVCT